MAALIWLVLGIVLIAAEVLSGDFVLLMLGAAALAGAGAQALTGDLVAATAVFALVSVALVTLARPWLTRRAHPAAVRDNVAALIGESAVVTATVDAHGGRVRLRGGEWSARALDPARVIEPGATVTVVEISGATAVVWPQDT